MLIDLLSELVSYKTVSKRDNDEKDEKRKCANFLASHLKDLGLEVQLADKTGPNNVTSYNVIASRKTSEEILTICSYCKKIRGPEGHYEEIEKYFHRLSKASISHGICPECYKREMERIKSYQ